VAKRIRSGKSKLPAVTRREYAEVVVRLGSLEIQVQRNRTTIELQAQRIVELQEQIDALKAPAVAQQLTQELAAVPLAPGIPTVES
jgi:hypothetical protein